MEDIADDVPSMLQGPPAKRRKGRPVGSLQKQSTRFSEPTHPPDASAGLVFCLVRHSIFFRSVAATYSQCNKGYLKKILSECQYTESDCLEKSTQGRDLYTGTKQNSNYKT